MGSIHNILMAMIFIQWVITIKFQGIIADTVETVSEFRDNHQGKGAGIYYESLEKIKVYSTSFNLLTHVNISSYHVKFEELNFMLKNTNDLCKINKHNISIICKNYNLTLKLAINELNKRYTTLMSLQKSRARRGLINAIGSFENWAFGVVDDEAYQKLQDSIKTNTNKNDNTLQIMKKQTKLVQSSINQISNISSTISQNFIKVQNEYNTLINKIKNKYNTIIELEIDQQLMNYLINFNILLTEFSFEIEEMIDSLVLARHNIFHPTILKNTKLLEILENIQNTLPNTQVLPVDITMDTAIDEFLKLVKIKTRFYNYQVLFILTFPLFDPTDYTLFRVWPMPIEITNSQFIFIKPQNPYLAIAKDNQHFISLTESEIQKCTVLSGSLSYFLQVPIFTKNNQLCEIQLFNSISSPKLPKQCTVGHQIFNESYFFKLSNSNQFIYWVTTTTTVTLACSHETTQHTIQGAGILTIPNTCILYTPTTVLKPTKTTEKQISLSFHPNFPLINVTDINIKIKKIEDSKLQPITLFNYTVPQLHDLHKSSGNLDSIINDIDKELENNKITNNIYLHQYGLYLISGLVGYMVLHILIQRVRECCSGENGIIVEYRNRPSITRECAV